MAEGNIRDWLRLAAKFDKSDIFAFSEVIDLQKPCWYKSSLSRLASGVVLQAIV